MTSARAPARKPIRYPKPAVASAPTLGDIKRALHELARATSHPGGHDNGADMREAHDLLRGLAARSGIDPDAAVRQRLAAVKALRERMVHSSAMASERTSG